MKSFLSGRPQHDQPFSAPQPFSTGGGLSRLNQAHAAESACAKTPSASPTVECIKQGDKVVRLIVTCACGERIEVDCLYPNAS